MVMIDHCEPRLREVRAEERRYYEYWLQEATSFKSLAEHICKRLYKKFPRSERDKYIKGFLKEFNKLELYEEWFGGR